MFSTTCKKTHPPALTAVTQHADNSREVFSYATEPCQRDPSLAARRTRVHKRRTGLSLFTLRWRSHESQAISTATSETLDRPCQEEIPPQSRPGPNRKSPPPTFCRVVVGGKSKMLTQGSANTRGEPSCHYKPCRKSHKLAALHGKLDLSPCACATQQRATAQTAQDKPCCNAHTSHLDTCTHAPCSLIFSTGGRAGEQSCPQRVSSHPGVAFKCAASFVFANIPGALLGS